MKAFQSYSSVHDYPSTLTHTSYLTLDNPFRQSQVRTYLIETMHTIQKPQQRQTALVTVAHQALKNRMFFLVDTKMVGILLLMRVQRHGSDARSVYRERRVMCVDVGLGSVVTMGLDTWLRGVMHAIMTTDRGGV